MGSKRYKFSRYDMYSKIEAFLKDYKPEPGRCLLVGDSLRGKGDDTIVINNPAIVDMLPKECEVLAPPYPDVDMQDMPYADKSFDYVIADQVLEHVRKPWIAVEEVWRVLKPGGIAILTSCLLHPVHGIPHDYFRYTPAGLESLCDAFFMIHRCDGMGNLSMVLNCFKGNRGKQVVPGQPIEQLAIANDHINLLHVWIIAEK